MKHGIKILYGILTIGILISMIHFFNNEGGVALSNIVETLSVTSIILFLSTIVFTFLSFKENIKKTRVWFFIIISFPLAFSSIKNLTKELMLRNTETTTPEKYLSTVKVSPEKYNHDKIRLQKLVDSLIKVKIIQRPSELALRYFNGKTYNDTIERDWAIDLPEQIEYKKTIIDTLFYSDDGKNIVAGLLINKHYNKYSNTLEYFGKGFKFDEKKWKPIEMLKYSVTGYDNYKSCSDRLRYFYLKKIGTNKGQFNINDTRFLNKKSK